METETGFNSKQVTHYTDIGLKLAKPIFSSLEIAIAHLLIVLYTLINPLQDKKCYALLTFSCLLKMYALNNSFSIAALAISNRC